MKKTFKMIYFKSYKHDENDRIGRLTEDEYICLLPFSDKLRSGSGYPGDISMLVFDKIYDRCKEVLKNKHYNYDIEVAIC